jgi:hypothetical protein
LGQLHPQGASDSDQGVTPAEALESQAIGDHRGLVFIDTIDGQPPRVDNMGTLVLDTDYVEGLLVVQGHVVFRPRQWEVRRPQSISGCPVAWGQVPVLSGIPVSGVLSAGTIS